MNQSAEAESMRDTARVQQEIKRVIETIAGIRESVDAANTALWGPGPTGPEDKSPALVPIGFFAETINMLAGLRAEVDRLASQAKRLRTL